MAEQRAGRALGTRITLGGEPHDSQKSLLGALHKWEIDVHYVKPLEFWGLLVVFLTVNFYEFQITFPTVDSSLLYKNSGWQSGNGILRMKMLVLAKLVDGRIEIGSKESSLIKMWKDHDDGPFLGPDPLPVSLGSSLGFSTHLPTHSAPIPSTVKTLGTLPLSTVLNLGFTEQCSGNDPGLKH